MPIAIKFHTTGSWGAGIDRDLTAAEVDTNFNNIKTFAEALEAGLPAANGIASITVDGRNMNVTLQDGQVLGPFPLPVLEFHFRNAWQPFAVYAELDAFGVEGKGIYDVLIAHTAGATFDENLLIGGDPVYNKLFGADPAFLALSIVYDLGFYYPGRPQDSTNTLLFDFPVLRKILLPISGSQHKASLTTAPGVNVQVYPVSHNSTQIGTVTFAVGSNVGTFAWTITADENLVFGDHLKVGQAATADAAAAGLAINFAMQRVTT